MINPYAPPDMENQKAARSSVSAINGALIGIGIGLLTCDFLDLTPSDITPLYGWRNGIIVFGLLGTFVGYLRRDEIAWRWLILLGFLTSSLGFTIGATVFSQSPLNVYTAVMIGTGLGYIFLGAMIGLNRRRRSS